MIDEPLRSWVATNMTFLKPLDISEQELEDEV
jgi:hypothetical protein